MDDQEALDFPYYSHITTPVIISIYYIHLVLAITPHHSSPSSHHTPISPEQPTYYVDRGGRAGDRHPPRDGSHPVDERRKQAPNVPSSFMPTVNRHELI